MVRFEISVQSTVVPGCLLYGEIVLFDPSNGKSGVIEFEETGGHTYMHRVSGFVPEPDSQLDKTIHACLKAMWAGRFEKLHLDWEEGQL